MDSQTWHQNAHERLAALGDAIRRRAPGTLYGALSAAAILPVVAAVNQGDFAALVALTGVVGGGGSQTDVMQSTGDNSPVTRADRGGKVFINSKVFLAPAGPGHIAPKTLLRTYLEQVVKDTGALDLAGVDKRTASDPEAARLQLTAVYTALDTLRSESSEHEKWAGRKQGLVFALPRERERQSVLAYANGAKYAALLGDPGSGKTTFASFLALCLAGEILGEERANLARLGGEWKAGALLPVRVVLSQFAAQLAAQPDTSGNLLWDYVIRRLGPGLDGFAPLLKQAFVQDGGLLVLDGLDEVPEANHRREIVKAAVLEFKRQFPEVRILLTSRTYAYQNQAWRLPGFDEAVLAPFTPRQIDLFVDNWYAHMAHVRPNLSSDEAQGRAQRLKETVHRERHLALLAERPLLLTLMASLHAWRGGTLPDDREQLYDESVDLLLDVWERPKEVVDADGTTILQTESLAEWLRAPQGDVRQALEGLAFRAHRDQPQRTGAADISEDALAGALLKVAKGRDLTLDRIIDYIRDRAGLLVNRGEGIYSFPHRTFQEYLAARHLIETDFPDRLVELVRADPERWREVMLLAGAKVKRGRPFAAWTLVDALCFGDCGDGAGDADWYAALLAGQLLVETGMHKAAGTPATMAKVARVRGWLTRLVSEGHLPSVDRAAAGRALGWLGDERRGVSVNVRAGAEIPDIDWVRVDARPFIMGEGQEQFVCRIVIAPYRISRYPVTVAQYQAFIRSGGYGEQRLWTEEGWNWRMRSMRIGPEAYSSAFQTPNQPQVGVTWYEAIAFCAWLSEVLGQKVRLATEAEWERAARSTNGRMYPWGGEFDPRYCNMGDTGIGAPSAVGMFPNGVAECGAADMAGSVWEWCSTKWLMNYESYEKRVDNNLDSKGPRTLRGGAFCVGQSDVHCSFRGMLSPDNAGNYVGFRVVSSDLGCSDL